MSRPDLRGTGRHPDPRVHVPGSPKLGAPATSCCRGEAGGDPNLSWSFGGGDGSPGHTIFVLTVVAGAGRATVVDAMLKAGAEVGGQPRGGDALVAAAGGNHVEVLRILTDAGADLNYKDRSGDTPLGAAVEAGAREAISFLEERGAREW